MWALTSKVGLAKKLSNCMGSVGSSVLGTSDPY